jgi:hypothetical protein
VVVHPLAIVLRVAAYLVCVACTAVTPPSRSPTLQASTALPSPTASSTPTTSPTTTPVPAATPAGHSTDPTAVLLRMEDHSDCTPESRACASLVVFTLYGDGRAVYRTSLAETSAVVRIVQLDEPAVDEILAFSIDDGGLRDIREDFTSWNETPYVSFEVRSPTLTDVVGVGEPLSQLVETSVPSHERVAALARRLRGFDAEVGDRATPPANCDRTPLGTIPRDDRAAWDAPIWQSAGAGVWAAPLLGPDPPPAYIGFPSSVSEFKVLWWVPYGHGHPLDVHIARIPDGVGAQLAVDLVLGADPAFPNRPDRPSGIPSLPPGCYTFSVSIDSAAGILVEQVVL